MEGSRPGEFNGAANTRSKKVSSNIFHFIKNVVMTGGMLQIVAFGAGALSIDNGR